MTKTTTTKQARNKQRRPKPQAKSSTVKVVKVVRRPKTPRRVKQAVSGQIKLADYSPDVTRNAVRLAYSLANPASTPNLRVCGGGDTVPTAAAQIHNIFNYSCADALGTYASYVPAGTLPICLFKDVLRNMIRLVPNPEGLDMSYTGTFHTSDLTLKDARPSPIQPLYLSAINSAPAGVAVSADFQPHGARLYPGKVMKHGKDLRFFWLDKNTQMFLEVSNPAVGDTVTMYQVNNNTGNVDEIDAAIAIAPSNIFYYRPETQGYYAMEYVPAAAAATRGIASFGVTTNTIKSGDTRVVTMGDSFGHLALPGIDDNLSVLTKYRVDAGSVLCSPTANMLNISGTIHGVQCNDPVNWINNIQTADINTVPGREDFLYSRRTFAQGMYAFLKPTNPDEFNFITGCSYLQGTLTDCYYPLDSSNGYIAICAASQSVAGANPGAIMELTSFTSIEWHTTSQLFETHDSPFSTIDTWGALDLLRKIPTFYDNPIHISAIKRGMTSVLRFVRSNRKIFETAMSGLFPTLKFAIDAGSSVLDHYNV